MKPIDPRYYVFNFDNTGRHPMLNGNMRALEKEPTTPCLIKTVFDVQNNPIIAKESTIPNFDVNETTRDEYHTSITDNISSDASSCVQFARQL